MKKVPLNKTQRLPPTLETPNSSRKATMAQRSLPPPCAGWENLGTSFESAPTSPSIFNYYNVDGKPGRLCYSHNYQQEFCHFDRLVREILNVEG